MTTSNQHFYLENGYLVPQPRLIFIRSRDTSHTRTMLLSVSLTLPVPPVIMQTVLDFYGRTHTIEELYYGAIIYHRSCPARGWSDLITFQGRQSSPNLEQLEQYALFAAKQLQLTSLVYQSVAQYFISSEIWIPLYLPLPAHINSQIAQYLDLPILLQSRALVLYATPSFRPVKQLQMHGVQHTLATSKPPPGRLHDDAT